MSEIQKNTPDNLIPENIDDKSSNGYYDRKECLDNPVNSVESKEEFYCGETKLPYVQFYDRMKSLPIGSRDRACKLAEIEYELVDNLFKYVHSENDIKIALQCPKDVLFSMEQNPYFVIDATADVRMRYGKIQNDVNNLYEQIGMTRKESDTNPVEALEILIGRGKFRDNNTYKTILDDAQVIIKEAAELSIDLIQDGRLDSDLSFLSSAMCNAIIQGVPYDYSSEREEPKLSFQELNLGEEASITKLSNSQVERILEETQIKGEDFMGESLTVEKLAKIGLAPRYEVKIDNATIGLSAIFDTDNHEAVVGYVNTGDGKIIARPFYLSNSQNTWRYLPRYDANDNGMVGYYDKGFGEESVTVPIALQKALAEIDNAGDKIENGVENILFGLSTYLCNDDYGKEVLQKGDTISGIAKTDRNNNTKLIPESLVVSPDKSPVFLNIIDKWAGNTQLYGNVTAEIFESKDRSLKYLFYSDQNGRAWIGAIEENGSKITSTGLRKSWIDAFDLLTPAYEYNSQVSNYGNYNLENGNYVDMFQNYISRIPIIKEYLAYKQSLYLDSWHYL